MQSVYNRSGVRVTVQMMELPVGVTGRKMGLPVGVTGRKMGFRVGGVDSVIPLQAIGNRFLAHFRGCVNEKDSPLNASR